MNTKSIVTKAFLSMMAATIVFAASNGFAAEQRAAADTHRVDVIETPYGTAVVQKDSTKAGDKEKETRVDIIEHAGSGGPTYSYTKSISH
jgi:hypothetical protein